MLRHSFPPTPSHPRALLQQVPSLEAHSTQCSRAPMLRPAVIHAQKPTPTWHILLELGAHEVGREVSPFPGTLGHTVQYRGACRRPGDPGERGMQAWSHCSHPGGAAWLGAAPPEEEVGEGVPAQCQSSPPTQAAVQGPM